MRFSYTWAVEQRRLVSSPWLVTAMDSELSTMDMTQFGNRKMQELVEWDFSSPNTRLMVYTWGCPEK